MKYITYILMALSLVTAATWGTLTSFAKQEPEFVASSVVQASVEQQESTKPMMAFGVGSEQSATLKGGAQPQVSDSVSVAVSHAFKGRVTTWTKPSGERVYVAHCRQAKEGCETRLETIASYVEQSAEKHGIDPFLLAAIVVKESGLNPFATGGIGERGVVQLHPLGIGKHSKFVKKEWYRKRCMRKVGACQDEVLDLGAKLLRRALDNCGSVAEALGKYNQGVCKETGYSKRVLRERTRLLGLAKRS